MKKKIFTMKNGFTLIELMITVSIFAAMTAYLLAKYGQFNQSMLLTNLAYDVALTIRTAQSYGLNVKAVSAKDSTDPASFNYPYGVHFNKDENSCFVLFVDDFPEDGFYNDSEYCTSTGASLREKISSYTIKRNSIVSSLCVKRDDSDDCTSPENNIKMLHITFKRPDPNAIIFAEDYVGGFDSWPYAEIILMANDGVTTKKIIVRSTGQIAITN